MPVIDKLAVLVQRLESGLLVLLFAAMLVVSASQVLERNLADAGLAWGDSFVRVMVLWITVIGALVASRNDSHIRIDLIAHLLTDRHKRWLRRGSALFTACVCGVFAWYSGQFVVYEYQDGVIAFAAVPAWICEIVMPLGFGSMSLRYLLHAVRPS